LIVAVAAMPDLVSDVLREYGGVTRQALQDYLPRREPRRHLYDLLSDYPQRGGKMMRPSLCIATARAFGGRLEEALGSAVAIELLHNALLIHDDIEDESEERRGRPTLHVLHGIPLAINVGDMLTLTSLRPLIENRERIGPWLALRILEETERMACESAEGQAMELGWRRDNSLDVGDDDYLQMVLKKTCWLAAIHPCRVGALIGTRGGIGGGVELEPFVRFGFFLGASFQIHDDLLNLVGDPELYGKELAGDLWEGKRTLMLTHLFREAAPAQRDRLGELLRLPREEKTAADIQWMRRLMDACGSVDYARHVAHGLAGAALHEFSLIYGGLPDSRDKRFIEGMVTWVFERDS
jgi:geranylgeranyl diphosphate synthase type II